MRPIIAASVLSLLGACRYAGVGAGQSAPLICID